MTQQQSVESLIGMQVRDSAGDKVGKIGQVWINEATGRPAWASVRTGMFGATESFMPLDDRCHVEQDHLRVPFDKETVKDAPRIEAEGDLSVTQQDELYRYYRMGRSPAGAGGTGAGGSAGTAGTGRTTDAGDAGATGTMEDRSHAGTDAMADRSHTGTGGPVEDRSRTGMPADRSGRRHDAPAAGERLPGGDRPGRDEC